MMILRTMKIVLFLGLFFISYSSYSQITKDSCDLMVRVVNKSKYHIDKVIINKSMVIDSLDSDCHSDFKCTQNIFTSLNYDITFTKKRFLCRPIWVHIISHPIDYIGEKEVKRGQFDLLLTIDKISKEKYDIVFEKKQINNGP